MTTIHLALTIGPIHKTFSQAKQTRAVWAASYMFSWVVKNIVANAKKSGVMILLPDEGEYISEFGSGMYADRIYFEGDETTQATIEEIVSKIIKQLAADIDDNNPPVAFLENYFNIHFVSIPKDGNDSNHSFPLERLNKLLDHKELMQNFVFEIDKNPLFEYLAKRLKENSILKVAAFGEGNTRQFRSIPEIASESLQRSYLKKYDKALIADYNDENTDLYEELKKREIEILPHQKYYAVIYADGDNIGKVISDILEKKQDIKVFSKKLFEFAKRAESTINNYGGNSIYLGGEDILAFAPIACVNSDGSGLQTIFDLVENIDKDFVDVMGDFKDADGHPISTLSFGIMLSYVKHPLKEAMRYAHKLLDDKAKNVESKNSIAICLRKHSGQMMECVIDKGKTETYVNLQVLITGLTGNDNADFLAGIMHRFNDDLFFDLFSASVEADRTQTDSDKPVRLQAFFDKFFNEAIHESKRDFIDKIQSFSIQLFKNYEERETRKAILFFVLRYIHFINSKNERN